MAELAGVTKGAYFKWEHGINMPSIDGAMRIADHFDLSLDEMCGRIVSQGGNDNEDVVLGAYRKLDASAREVVLTLLLRLSQGERDESTLQRGEANAKSRGRKDNGSQ